jgi:hypothetical protein
LESSGESNKFFRVLKVFLFFLLPMLLVIAPFAEAPAVQPLTSVHFCDDHFDHLAIAQQSDAHKTCSQPSRGTKWRPGVTSEGIEQ